MNPVALAVGATVLLILLAGIVQNFRARRRERTNSKCALAVVFAMVGGAVLVVGGMLMLADSLPAPLRAVPGLIALVAIVIAAILAGLGLAEMKPFAERYDRGRRRAIAVLAFPVLLAAVIVAAVCAHSSGHPIFGALIGGTAGTTLTSKDRNFQLIAPPPWVTTDGTRLHPDASVGLARGGPPMTAVLIAQDLARTGATQLSGAVENVKTQIQADPQAQILAENDENENGLAGRRIEVMTTSEGSRQFQVRWLTENSGIFYQLLIRGPATAREQILSESRKLAAGFRVLDPNLHPAEAGEPAPATFTSRSFGYAIDLTNTVWNRRWPKLAQDVPFAEFGVLNDRGSAAFCVIPVWIGDDTLDLDVLAAALAARVGVTYNRDSIFGTRDLRQGPLRGRAFGSERTQDNVRLLYRLRVLRGRGYAYLLATWMNKERESTSDFLDLALGCVSFPEQVEPDPLILGDRLRGTHSLVWNDVGAAFLRAGQAEAALPWFQRAYAVERTHLLPLSNYATASIKAGRAAEALSYLDQQLVDFPGSPDLLRLRATLLEATGRRP